MDKSEAFGTAAPSAPAVAPAPKSLNAPDIILSGAQLLEALDFIAPDRANDPDQLESEVAFGYGEGHSGKAMYIWCAEYPEEGSFVCDGSSVTAAPAQADPQGSNPPFANCSFHICDLPGQCLGEGKCHHPRGKYEQQGDGGETSGPKPFTGEQIAALRIAADALIERYAAPIREILCNAEVIEQPSARVALSDEQRAEFADWARFIGTASLEERLEFVAHIERMVLAASVSEAVRTIYDQRTLVDERVRNAAPLLYYALKKLLEAVEERPDRVGIESVTLSDAHAAIDRANAGEGKS
ncbi:MAG: hypothetical protein ACTHKE_03425 [Sphingomicrobium sp.]